MPCASAATRCGAFPFLFFAPRGPADESTFRRAFALVSADALDRVLGAWLHTRAMRAGGRLVVAIDGKAVRAGRAQQGQDIRAGIGGPLSDRGKRLRPGDYRCDPDGEQPGQLMLPPAPLPRIRDLGQEIKQAQARMCPGSASMPLTWAPPQVRGVVEG